MAGLKHDACRCREDAKSQQIRLSNGWLTPAERQEREERETKQRLAAKKKATKGMPLTGLEED